MRKENYGFKYLEFKRFFVAISPLKSIIFYIEVCDEGL